jgi:hypothetical protein
VGITRLSKRALRILVILVGLGLAIRLAIAFGSDVLRNDIRALPKVRSALLDDPLHVYSATSAAQGIGDLPAGSSWPYPPAFFPWIALSRPVTSAGIPFPGFMELPPILADVAIALLVQDYLGRRGRSDSTRLLAAALVLLGPVFVVISTYQGQIDSLAMLPVVIAIWMWDHPRMPAGRPGARALAAGALIGLAAATKSFPLVFLLAFVVAMRTRREAAILVGAALAVPLALLLPFAIADLDGVRRGLDYSGYPGAGGLSLLVQPGLAENWLETSPLLIVLSGPSRLLRDHGTELLLVVYALLGWLLVRRRPPLADSCALVALLTVCLSPAFFLQYTIWFLPLLLLAGRVGAVALIEAVLIVPLLLFYWVDPPAQVEIYVAAMAILWLLWVAIAAAIARDTGGRRPCPRRPVAEV